MVKAAAENRNRGVATILLRASATQSMSAQAAKRSDTGGIRPSFGRLVSDTIGAT